MKSTLLFRASPREGTYGVILGNFSNDTVTPLQPPNPLTYPHSWPKFWCNALEMVSMVLGQSVVSSKERSGGTKLFCKVLCKHNKISLFFIVAFLKKENIILVLLFRTFLSVEI